MSSRKKLTKSQVEKLRTLLRNFNEVETEMNNLWFEIDSNNPADAQLFILMDMASSISYTLRSILNINGG